MSIIANQNEEEVTLQHHNEESNSRIDKTFNELIQFVSPMIETHPIANYDLIIADRMGQPIYEFYNKWKRSQSAQSKPSLLHANRLLRLWKQHVGTEAATPANFIALLKYNESATDIIEQVKKRFVTDDTSFDPGSLKFNRTRSVYEFETSRY